jgi:PPOX class probable F420-dependent enzyme
MMPGMEEPVMRSRFTAARVATLATVRDGRAPHLVPCCFALEADVLYTAVDAKPKSTLSLQRVANVRRDPQVSLLVHHYDDDWSTLWWVRATGLATVLEGDDRDHALFLLAAKYPQYRSDPPPGAVIAVEVRDWQAWP